MQKLHKVALVAAAGIGLPLLSQAQDSGIADELQSLHGVLDQLYKDMLPCAAS
jgi:hypothetical protein